MTVINADGAAVTASIYESMNITLEAPVVSWLIKTARLRLHLYGN